MIFILAYILLVDLNARITGKSVKCDAFGDGHVQLDKTTREAVYCQPAVSLYRGSVTRVKSEVIIEELTSLRLQKERVSLGY